MAEILLSLTIIGVVAAITLPSLTGNINERTWNTQRKALYARFSQAISLMPSLNGYGKYNGTNTDGIVSTTEDTAAEVFITDGLSKVLKINNICDYQHLEDCGIATSYTDFKGNKKAMPIKLSEMNSMFTGKWSDTYPNPQKDIDTHAAAFETVNGESIVVFYNPFCIADKDEGHYVQPMMCANFVYDLNGQKGPNTVGKDIAFITAMYPTDSVVVAPIVAHDTQSNQFDAGKACTTIDSESRVPNKDELAAIFYNQEFLGRDGLGPWSSSVTSPERAWHVNCQIGRRYTDDRERTRTVRCIKR